MTTKPPATWRKTVTLILCAVVGISLVVWDIYAVYWGADDAQDSISRSALALLRSHPTVLLVIGFVLGHLFWPQYIETEKKDGQS